MSTQPRAHGDDGRSDRRRRGLSASSALFIVCGLLALTGLVLDAGAPVVLALALVAALWPTAHRTDQQARQRARRAAAAASMAQRPPLHASLAGRVQPLVAPPSGHVEHVRGHARLLFVEADGDVITVDGLLAPAGGAEDRPRTPFWLRLRRPGPEWMTASMLTVVHTWASDGRPVQVETRPSGSGYQATLVAGSSRLVLELEEVGGIADAA